jgi:hypothetical protein
MFPSSSNCHRIISKTRVSTIIITIIMTMSCPTINYPSTLGVIRLTDAMEKPSTDNRTYRVIRLPNELEALLIHDAETNKASAALDINAGSFNDPEDTPGLAHAVEHMLFMGTQKVNKFFYIK